MTSRERVERTLRFEGPDRIPTDVWVLPAAFLMHGSALRNLLDEFPADFNRTYFETEADLPPTHRLGTWRDEWGVLWHNEIPGLWAQVQEHPLKDWSALKHCKPPRGIPSADLAKHPREEKASAALFTDPAVPSLFHRMNALRPTGLLMMDLMDESAEFFTLLDMVHDFNLRCLRDILQRPSDGISIYDDWGSQQQLLIPPRLWRKHFKPRYREYVETAHRAGRLFLFHSDGYIGEIIEDFIEIGVDALNSQMWIMDVEDLARRFAGRLTFWGELDRQWLLPRGTREEIEAAVRKAVGLFHTGKGGYICQCEMAAEMPLESIRAVLEAWEKYR